MTYLCRVFFRVRKTGEGLGCHNKTKKLIKTKINMIRQEFATRRAGSVALTADWARNRNAVRHAPRVTLGPVSHTITVMLLVLIVGLIYVTQGTKATSYDYALNSVNDEIASLEAQNNSLAAENARIVAATASEQNEVALTMVDARAAGYVAE